MTARLRKVPLTIFQRFFRTETLGGLVLLGFGLAALAIANSPLSEAYNHLWEIPLTVGIAPHELSLSFHEWINDGLMAVFFSWLASKSNESCWLVNCPLPGRPCFPSRAQSEEWLCPR